MSQQGAYARAEDPNTSHEAAERVNVTTLEAAVLRCLRDAPEGLIVDDVAERLEVRDKSISPRMKPLESRALIFRNGIRKNSRDRNQIVWLHWTFLTEDQRAARFKALAQRKPSARQLLAGIYEHFQNGTAVPESVQESVHQFFKKRKGQRRNHAN